MGTRNLTCVQKDNKLIVAKYCQWDGYPDGQGRTVVDFILNKFDKVLFLKKIRNVSDMTTEELDEKWVECGAEPDTSGVNMTVSAKFKANYPYLHRDMGGEILEYIQNLEGELKILFSKDFAIDSLFCEYAYVLNLDEDTLDFFTGFNTDGPQRNIFFDPETDELERKKHRETIYYPVKKMETFTFDEIRKQGAENIVKKMQKCENRGE